MFLVWRNSFYRAYKVKFEQNGLKIKLNSIFNPLTINEFLYFDLVLS